MSLTLAVAVLLFFLAASIGRRRRQTTTAAELGPPPAHSCKSTVLEAVQRSLSFIVDEVGVGEHGLIRMLSSDWDDGFSAKDLVPRTAYNVSESTLTAGLVTVALPRIAEVLDTLGGDPAVSVDSETL